MNGARLARSKPIRLLVLSVASLILLLLLLAIYQTTQNQLDESRNQRIHCEQQQDGLNNQLQLTVRKKFLIEKSLNSERMECAEAKRNLQQEIKDLEKLSARNLQESQVRSESHDKVYNLLKTKYEELKNNSEKNNKLQLENINALEKKLATLTVELQEQKDLHKKELKVLRAQSIEQVTALEHMVSEYRANCTHKATGDKIAQKPIKKLSEETETQLKQQPSDEQPSKIEESAVGAVALPISAPSKPTSTTTPKTAQKMQEANANLKQAVNATSSTSKNVAAAGGEATAAVVAFSSSAFPPIAAPRKSRKLPENVAPIPANFDDLIKNEQNDIAAAEGNNLADINAAIEDTQKGENDNGNNNRYANIVNDIEQKNKNSNKNGGFAENQDTDSGAHEIKDHDEHNVMNDENFNLPNGGDNDDGNFFDGEKNLNANEKDSNKAIADTNNEDDGLGVGGGGGVGDIAVKNHNQLLDANNLNNEIAGDQGKEFPDGLRLEEAIEEEEDEDDYSNPGMRPQDAQAIRI